jgi:hypothetical protein
VSGPQTVWFTTGYDDSRDEPVRYHVEVGSATYERLLSLGHEPEGGPADDEAGGGQPAPGDYSTLKQPQLKALLTERGVEFPSGPVKNEALVELLKADDEAKIAANPPE